MEFDRTGIILYTIEYEKCVSFYENTLELTKMFATETLTCFEFGNSYLMVELTSKFDKSEAQKERVKTCLRMNVPNVKKFANKLIEKNVEVDYQERSWGTVAKFSDPDGNLCAFRDSEKFENDIVNFKTE